MKSLRGVTFIILFCFSLSVYSEVKFHIYTEISPPYQTLEVDVVSGIATKKVKALLAQVGYQSEFHVLPWARAYKKSQYSANSLIYSIAKTPERLDEFHWIMPVAKFELALISLSQTPISNLEEWRDIGSYSIAVQRDDIGEHWAKSKGLREGKELLSCADILCSWTYLLNNKVDMIIEDPNLLPEMIAKLNLSEEQIKIVKYIPELAVTGYLAANRQMSKELVEELKLAHQQLEPLH